MKVSSSITSSSFRTVGSFKKVSNIPARVQSRWVLSLLVSRFSSFCNRFSLCLAAVSFRSATYCLCFSFSNSSLIGNFSFLIMGKTKATNFLQLSPLAWSLFDFLYLSFAAKTCYNIKYYTYERGQ